MELSPLALQLFAQLLSLTLRNWNSSPEKYNDLPKLLDGILPDEKQLVSTTLTATPLQVYITTVRVLVEEVSASSKQSLSEDVRGDLVKRENALREVLVNDTEQLKKLGSAPSGLSSLRAHVQLCNAAQALGAWSSEQPEKVSSEFPAFSCMAKLVQYVEVEASLRSSSLPALSGVSKAGQVDIVPLPASHRCSGELVCYFRRGAHLPSYA